MTPENVRAAAASRGLGSPAGRDAASCWNDRQAYQGEFRVRRPNGEVRWCFGSAAPTVDESGKVVRISGVTVDITDRKEAEERQALLAREVDHRAKNALALVQSIVRLTRAGSVAAYVGGGRRAHPGAVARAHGAGAVALARRRPRRTGGGGAGAVPHRRHQTRSSLQGPRVLLQPTPAQTLALALHELATNAAKYGALSCETGTVKLAWEVKAGTLSICTGAKPAARRRASLPRQGFGTRLILASIEGQLGGKAQFRLAPRRAAMHAVGAAERQARASRSRTPRSHHNAPSGTCRQIPPSR